MKNKYIQERSKIDLDALFPEDIELYYTIADEYLELNPENYTLAYKLTTRAWALADRWNDLAANAGKLATVKDISKTELQKYCYGKYRQMQLMHEHCRSIWKAGEDANRGGIK